MNIILLSGGSGKRLWPLSNETRSKQFIKLLDINMEHESMVQRVYRQLTEKYSDVNVVVATSASQSDAIKNQLGNSVDIVIEPERRDTYPAICLAVAYLHYKKGVPLDDAVIVMPVDPYAEQSYFDTLQKMYKTATKEMSNITLMGIEPTYPSEKYGYILPLSDGKMNFFEKPSKNEAQRLIASGAYWNGGVFGFQLGYIMKNLGNLFTHQSYENVLHNFTELPKISFDYAVVENEHNVNV